MRAFEVVLWLLPETILTAETILSTENTHLMGLLLHDMFTCTALGPPACVVTGLYCGHNWPEGHSDLRPMEHLSVFMFLLVHRAQSCHCSIKH